MSDATEKEVKTSRKEKSAEIIATVFLSIAAFAAAWCGYQASVWNGIQSSKYVEASALRTQATQAHLEANQDRLADLGVFENYIDAAQQGDSELAQFYRERARDELAPAFEAWLATNPLENSDAPPNPLAMPEYELSADKEAKKLGDEAQAKFEDGERAKKVSDTYVFTTIFFASVLFLAAIAERLEFFGLRIGLISVAGVALIAGLIVTFMQPVTRG